MAAEAKAPTLAEDAFILWDTCGYPIDLTEVMAIDYGLTVDKEGFNASMEEARQKAMLVFYQHSSWIRLGKAMLAFHPSSCRAVENGSGSFGALVGRVAKS